ncbi:hypothetical protein Tco_1245716 [Tanacetum coccineum]
MPSQALLHILISALFITLTFSSSPSPAPSPQSAYYPDNSPSMSPQSGNSDGPSSDVTLSPSQSLPPLSGTPDDDSYVDDPSPDVKSSPALAPSEASDVTPEEVKSEERKESSDKGMSGGKKVGVAFGLIAAACFVGFGGVVYRKRQDNIRRQQYIAAQRLEF